MSLTDTFSFEKASRVGIVLVIVAVGAVLVAFACFALELLFFGIPKDVTKTVEVPEKKETPVVAEKKTKKTGKTKKVVEEEEDETVFFKISFRIHGPPSKKDPSYSRLKKPVKTALKEYGVDFCDLQYERAALYFSVDSSNKKAVHEVLGEKFEVERIN